MERQLPLAEERDLSVGGVVTEGRDHWRFESMQTASAKSPFGASPPSASPGGHRWEARGEAAEGGDDASGAMRGDIAADEAQEIRERKRDRRELGEQVDEYLQRRFATQPWLSALLKRTLPAWVKAQLPFEVGEGWMPPELRGRADEVLMLEVKVELQAAPT